MKKAERVLVAYAVLKDSIDQGNLYAGLAEFFRPLAVQNAGEMFVPGHAADWFSKTYWIEIPAIVVETMAPVLCELGIIEKKSGDARFAQYVYAQQAKTVGRDSAEFEAQLAELTERFRGFCATLKLAVGPLLMESADVESEFCSRLLNLDSLSILSRQDGQLSPKKSESTITLGSSLAELQGRKSSEQFFDFAVCAFLVDLSERDPDLFAIAANVAAANLAAEALLSYREPPGSAEALSGMNVFLDGPLCLDVLGVNAGREQFGVEFLSLLEQAGVQVSVFEHTISEVERVLEARRNSYLEGIQDGPNEYTAEPASTRDVVRATVGYAEARLTGLIQNIQVVDGAASVSDPVRRRVTAEHEQRVRASLNNRNIESLDTDVASCCDLVRLKSISALPKKWAEAGVVFVTRNATVRNAANAFWREFLKEDRNVGPDALKRLLPISVSEKQFCGMAWIVSGGAIDGLNQSRLLANCRAAIATRRDVITQVLNLLLTASPHEVQPFRAILCDQRAERALMKITGGEPGVITASNLPDVLSEMKRATAQDLIDEHEQKLAELRRSSAQEKAQLSSDAARARAREEQAVRQQNEMRRLHSLEVSRRRGKARKRIRAAVKGYNLIHQASKVVFGLLVIALVLVVESEIGSFFESGFSFTGFAKFIVLLVVLLVLHWVEKIPWAKRFISFPARYWFERRLLDLDVDDHYRRLFAEAPATLRSRLPVMVSMK